MQQATRRGALEEQSESEDFHEAALSALGVVHRIQAQPSLCRQRRGRCVAAEFSARSHAGRSRCAAIQPRWARHVRGFSRWPGARLHQQHRRSRSDQHEQRDLSRADVRSATAAKKISTSPGSDATPIYSPDGNHIAWRSMARGGYEADKSSLVVYQRKLGESRNATQTFDRSVDSLTWTPDSKAIFFTAEDQGEMPIYALPLDAKTPREVSRLHAGDIVFSNDGKNLFFTQMSVMAPNEIGRLEIKEPLPTKAGRRHTPERRAARADFNAAAGAFHVQRRCER